MIAPVTNTRAYTCEFFREALKSHAPMGASMEGTSETALGYTAKVWMERLSPYLDNEVRDALAAAALSGETVARGDAIETVELDPSYKKLKWNPHSQQMIPDLVISTFFVDVKQDQITKYLGVAMDHSSTPDNPTVYVETCMDEKYEAYRIELNKIDLSDATLVEAYALAYFTSSCGEAKRFVGPNGILLGYEADYPDSYLNKINIFEKVKENVINTPGLSEFYKQNARAELDHIESNGCWQNAVVQFLALGEVIDDVRIAQCPVNKRSADDKFREVRTIESELWSRGIDTTYPDGTKYSERIGQS